jgi:uncharacterized DUF497 family protein
MYICTYNIKMEIEWDSEKAISNLKKHGIDLAWKPDSDYISKESNSQGNKAI